MQQESHLVFLIWKKAKRLNRTLGVEGSMGEWENEEEQILDKLVVVSNFIKKNKTKTVVTKRHPELAVASRQL